MPFIRNLTYKISIINYLKMHVQINCRCIHQIKTSKYGCLWRPEREKRLRQSIKVREETWNHEICVWWFIYWLWQGLTLWPWLAWNSQGSICLCPLNAEIKGMCRPVWPSCLFFNQSTCSRTPKYLSLHTANGGYFMIQFLIYFMLE